MDGFQNPFDTFKSGFGIGAQALQNQQIADANAAKLAAAEQERKAEAERADVLKKLSQPGATYEDYMKASILMPKDQAEALQKAAAGLDEKQQQSGLADDSAVFAALRSGNPQIARDLLARQAEAHRASGLPEDKKAAQFIDTLTGLIDTGEQGAKAVETLMGTKMAAYPKGRDAFEALNKMEADRRINNDVSLEQQKADLEYRKAQTQELLAKLEDEKPEHVKIDEGARTIMNKAAETVIDAERLASQAENLAAEIDKAKPANGWIGKGWEAIKGITGGQDKITALKQEYAKLRNTEVLKNLPPGVASDKDIEIAMGAFPKDDANPGYISSFMRGVAKLQRYTADVNKAKAEWANQNGSLGPARTEFEAGGQKVKKGMAFWDFTKKIQLPNVAGGVLAGSAPAKAPTEVDY
jgi:hypothetical protein